MFETFGNIGSFVGGVGVALSLAYLAVQIRITGQAAKAAAAQAVMQSLSEYLRSVSENAQLAKVITSAYKGLDELEESEITQFAFWTLAYMRLIELAYHHFKQGQISENFWKGQVNHLSGLMAVPAVSRIWNLRKSIFSEDFQQFTESLDPKNAVLAGDELLKKLRNASDA